MNPMVHVSRRLGLVLLASFAVMAAGCAGGGHSVKRDEGFSSIRAGGNTVIADGILLTVPNGWFFSVPDDEEDYGNLKPLYNMEEPGDDAAGKIVKLDQGVSYYQTVQAWVDTARESNTDVQVEDGVSRFDQRRFTKVSSTTTDGYIQRDAIFEQADGVYVVSLMMSSGYYYSNARAIEAVLDNAEFTTKNKSYRAIPTLPVFSSFNGAFTWYSDMDEIPGWTVFNNNKSPLQAMSVVKTTSNSIEEQATRAAGNEYSLEFFDASFSIGARAFNGRGGGFISAGSYYLIYHFTSGRDMYLLTLVFDSERVDRNYKTFHELPEVRDAMSRYLSF